VLAPDAERFPLAHLFAFLTLATGMPPNQTCQCRHDCLGVGVVMVESLSPCVVMIVLPFGGVGSFHEKACWNQDFFQRPHFIEASRRRAREGSVKVERSEPEGNLDGFLAGAHQSL
jgi:hypothetical protein